MDSKGFSCWFEDGVMKIRGKGKSVVMKGTKKGKGCVCVCVVSCVCVYLYVTTLKAQYNYSSPKSQQIRLD